MCGVGGKTTVVRRCLFICTSRLPILPLPCPLLVFMQCMHASDYIPTTTMIDRQQAACLIWRQKFNSWRRYFLEAQFLFWKPSRRSFPEAATPCRRRRRLACAKLCFGQVKVSSSTIYHLDLAACMHVVTSSPVDK